MIKKSFENDIILGMQHELTKQAHSSANLIKAGECLHGALEIFENHGLSKQADQIIQLLKHIAFKNAKPRVSNIPSIEQLYQAGITQRDMRGVSRGEIAAIAKINIIMRKLGSSDNDIAHFLGVNNVIENEEAFRLINPNQSIFSAAQKADRHTHGLTPEKEVANLKNHGTPFNLTDDNSVKVPKKPSKLTVDDMDNDFADMLGLSSFDIDASDDDLMGLNIKDDSMDVFDKDIPLESFEDEKD